MITYKEFNRFYTYRLGLIRSLLALGTLFTLIFNNFSDLFPYEVWLLKKTKPGLFIDKINLFFIGDYASIWIFYTLAILICVAVIVGYLPQITGILYAWVAYSVFYGFIIIEGGDQITAILSLLLVPVCLADKRINHWHSQIYFNYTINKYLHYFVFSVVCFMQLQMAFLYLDAGLEKCKTPEWLDGSAIYYWCNDYTFGADGFILKFLNLMFENKELTFIFNWSVILLELLLFAGIFIENKYKNILFYTAIIFHFFIFIVHGLPSFGLAMSAGLIILFKPVKKNVYINNVNTEDSYKNSNVQAE